MEQDRIEVRTGSLLASFKPSEAFGFAIDGGSANESRPLFMPANRPVITALRPRSVSYRLRTELGIEAWHWIARGHWSDETHRQGYWAGDPAAVDESDLTFGYRLPRRGDTLDEANNDGYSRIDDGDPRSFWKSNPYLDAQYTGVSGEHREWIVVQFAKPAFLDALEIRWGHPFARRYLVQYWEGADEYNGRWLDFPQGSVVDGTGGVAQLRLASQPVETRFVRILLLASSHTAAAGAADPRDALGYAVAEIRLGRRAPDGRLQDVLRHGRNRHSQTIIYVSSTDPWHRASDLDRDTEQPSLLRLWRTGLAGTGPMMIPIGILYDTPENALAELQYFKSIGIPIDRVELGEEPDGQLVTAADYGALYVEFAGLIRNRFPAITTGGPSLVNGVSDTWLDASADQSWTSQFLNYLRARNALDLLGFFSFEYFPFDNICGPATGKLIQETEIMQTLYRRLADDRVPHQIPWLITEYGLSAFAGRALVEVPSALLNADIVGDFLGHGGRTAYLYGYSPDVPIAGDSRCAGQGNTMLWEADARGQALWPMPTYFGNELMTKAWTQPDDQADQIFEATGRLKDNQGRSIVTAYPVLRSNGHWSVMLINRSTRSITTNIDFDAHGPEHRGPVDVEQYSPSRYRWKPGPIGGHPVIDLPPIHSQIGGWTAQLRLPPLSLTVVHE
jgi:hypothetical protein